MGPLERDAVWAGEVEVIGDVLIPAGKTLRIEPGTRVRFSRPPRWACSVFWRSAVGDAVDATMRELCDVVVAGRLEVMGTTDEPVLLGDGEPWGGITCVDRGAVDVRNATLTGSARISLQAFEDATIVGEDARCDGAEFGIVGWGASQIRWTGGAIRASRISVVCCQAARAHLVDVHDESAEGVSAIDWALMRVDGGRFAGPRKHCVVARDRAWVKLRRCRIADDATLDIVRLGGARVEVAA